MSVQGLIFVIISSYNHAQWIEEAIESVLTIYQQFELILIEDGSRDNSVEKIQKYAKKYDSLNFLLILKMKVFAIPVIRY